MQGQSLYAVDGPNLGPEMTDPYWVVVCRAVQLEVKINPSSSYPPARCLFDSLNGWEHLAFYASLVNQRGKDRQFGFGPFARALARLGRARCALRGT